MKTLVATLGIAAAALAATATAASPTLTLAASPTVVSYGKSVTLSGTLSTQKANQPITVTAMVCPSATTVNAAHVKTTANGAYATSVTPTAQTVYQATQKGAKSNAVTVTVKPLVKLGRLARGSFSTAVTAGMDLKGKAVLFQRYAKTRKRWVQVKKVVLKASAPGTPKPTVISSATFKAKAPKGARVRLLLSKAQAAPCYMSAKSNVARN